MDLSSLPSYETALLSNRSFAIGGRELPFNFFGTWEVPLIDPYEAAAVLELANVRKSVQDFTEDQKVIVTSSDSIGRSYQKVFLKIKGLYRLIGRSRKPYAIEFQEWIYDILEEIRMTGKFELEKQQLIYLRTLAAKDAELAVLKKTQERDERVKKREKDRESSRNAAGQHLYIYLDDRKYHKVGMTKQTINKRLSDQKTSLPDLILLATYNVVNCKLIENVVHFILEPYRVSPIPEFFDTDLSYIQGVIDRTIFFIEGYRFKINADCPMTTSIDISKLLSELQLNQHQKLINENVQEEGEIHEEAKQLITTKQTEGDHHEEKEEEEERHDNQYNIPSEKERDNTPKQKESNKDKSHVVEINRLNDSDEEIDQPPQQKMRNFTFDWCFSSSTLSLSKFSDASHFLQLIAYFTDKCRWMLTQEGEEMKYQGAFKTNTVENLYSMESFLSKRLNGIKVYPLSGQQILPLYEIQKQAGAVVLEGPTFSDISHYKFDWSFKQTVDVAKFSNFLSEDPNVSGINRAEKYVRSIRFKHYLRYNGFRNHEKIDFTQFGLEYHHKRVCNSCNAVRTGDRVSCCQQYKWNKSKSRLIYGVSIRYV